MTADIANQFMVTGINQNESNLIIVNPLDNQVNNHSPIFEVSTEKTTPVIEFTEIEKKAIK